MVVPYPTRHPSAAQAPNRPRADWSTRILGVLLMAALVTSGAFIGILPEAAQADTPHAVEDTTLVPPREGAAAVTHTHPNGDTYIYVFGGRDSAGEPLDQVVRFTPSGRWSTGDTTSEVLPVSFPGAGGRWGAGAATDGTHIYLFGGQQGPSRAEEHLDEVVLQQDHFLDEVLRFDPITLDFDVLPACSMVNGISGMAAYYDPIHDAVRALGGHYHTFEIQPSEFVIWLDPSAPVPCSTYDQIIFENGQERSQGTALWLDALDGPIYIGGWDSTLDSRPEVLHWSASTSWQPQHVAELSPPVSGAQALHDGGDPGNVYIFGGYDHGPVIPHDPHPNIQRLDLSGVPSILQTSDTVDLLPHPIGHLTGAWDHERGHAYLFGGSSTHATGIPLDPALNTEGVLRWSPRLPDPIAELAATPVAENPEEDLASGVHLEWRRPESHEARDHPWHPTGPVTQYEVHRTNSSTPPAAGSTTAAIVAAWECQDDPVQGGTWCSFTDWDAFAAGGTGVVHHWIRAVNAYGGSFLEHMESVSLPSEDHLLVCPEEHLPGLGLPCIHGRRLIPHEPDPTTLRNPLEGRVFETVLPVEGSPLPGIPFHDWDGDGIPDALDKVNLPSEAVFTALSGDQIVLVDGLGEADIVLLVEPRHHEAHLVLSDTVDSILGPLLPPGGGPIGPGTALEAVRTLYGVDIANVYAMVLHEGMEVHATLVPAFLPATVPLAWNASSVPADGSWILSRSDPTRSLQLVLGGQNVDPAPPAPSSWTATNRTEFRWEFHNLHGKAPLCFDPTASTGLTDCTFSLDLGWLRAYSGQAAYTLEALAGGFEGEHLPLVSSYAVLIDGTGGNIPLSGGPVTTQGSSDGEGSGDDALVNGSVEGLPELMAAWSDLGLGVTAAAVVDLLDVLRDPNRLRDPENRPHPRDFEVMDDPQVLLDKAAGLVGGVVGLVLDAAGDPTVPDEVEMLIGLLMEVVGIIEEEVQRVQETVDEAAEAALKEVDEAWNTTMDRLAELQALVDEAEERIGALEDCLFVADAMACMAGELGLGDEWEAAMEEADALAEAGLGIVGVVEDEVEEGVGIVEDQIASVEEEAEATVDGLVGSVLGLPDQVLELAGEVVDEALAIADRALEAPGDLDRYVEHGPAAVLPAGSNTDWVSGSLDWISMCPGTPRDGGSTLKVMAPDGRVMRFVHPGSPAWDPGLPVAFNLRGDVLPGGDAVASQWHVEGDLHGAALDGTWILWVDRSDDATYTCHGGQDGYSQPIMLSLDGVVLCYTHARAGGGGWNDVLTWNRHASTGVYVANADRECHAMQERGDVPLGDVVLDVERTPLVYRFYGDSVEGFGELVGDARSPVVLPPSLGGPRVAEFDPFDPESPIRYIGDDSRRFSTGIGVDYRFPGMPAGEASVVQVDPVLLDEGAGLPVDLPWEEAERRFVWQSMYVKMPAASVAPMLYLGLEPFDEDLFDDDGDVEENHAGHAFVVLGRHLAQWLGTGEEAEFEVEVDDSHRDGLVYRSVDVNGDGWNDLLVFVPHFSQVWLTVAAAGSTLSFWDVGMASPTEGWISGDRGKMWKYQTGSLQEVNLPPAFSNHRTLGLHVVSDKEFWITANPSGGSACQSGVLHYKDGSWLTALTLADMGAPFCRHLYAIWLNDAGTQGLAAGGDGTNAILATYSSANGWQPWSGPSPVRCSVVALSLTDNGAGYIAMNPTHDTNCYNFGDAGTPISHRSAAGAYSNQPGQWQDGFNFYDVVHEGSTRWAVGAAFGTPPSSGPGIYQYTNQFPAGWKQVPQSQIGNDGNYFGAAITPAQGHGFFVGAQRPGQGSDGIIMQWDSGSKSWTRHNASTPMPLLSGVHFATGKFGLAVGHHAIVQIEVNNPPVAQSTLAPSQGDSTTVFQGQDTGSYDPDGDPLTYEWDWGDGSISSTPSATHTYSQVGPHQVTFRVTDPAGATDTNTYTVSVGPKDVQPSKSTCHSGTYLHSSGFDRHHYRIPVDASKDRAVRVETCGSTPSGMYVEGSLGGAVGTVGSWPSQGAQGTVLTGVVAKGEELYFSVTRPDGVSGQDYGVKVWVAGAPHAPSFVSVPSVGDASYPVYVSARAGHPNSGDGFRTKLLVDWGDGSSVQVPASTYASPSTMHTVGHSYQQPGVYQVKFTGIDEYGIKGVTETRSVPVLDPPAGQAQQASNVGSSSATLHGEVLDMGGAPSVDARYRVVERGTGSVAYQSVWQTLNAAGPLSSVVATGLGSGRSYDVHVVTYNGLPETVSAGVLLETLPGLSVVPSITSSGALDAGLESWIKVVGDQSTLVEVEVLWGGGAVPHAYVPALAANLEREVKFKYPFPGEFEVEARYTSGGDRSVAARATLSVGGPDPVGLSHVAGLSDATVTATLSSSLAYPGSTDVRFRLYDPLAQSETVDAWITGLGNGASVQRTWSLQAGVEYPVGVDVRARSPVSGAVLGEWTSQEYLIATNRPPELEPVHTEPRSVGHFERVEFRVVYSDPDGDEPWLTKTGPPSPPVLILGGQNHVMKREPQETGPKDGIVYSYALNNLAPGQSHVPVFKVSDPYHDVDVTGAPVFVGPETAFLKDFESDTLGASPQGMVRFDVRAGEQNWWHVADSQAQGMPDRVALGKQGKVAWFAHPVRGNYHDPAGGSPAGILATTPVDLSMLKNPSLSFQSYFEAPSGGNAPNLEVVVQRQTTSGWSSWQVLPGGNLGGVNDGYKNWATVAYRLPQYAEDTVRIGFRFDAKNPWDNAHWGWMVGNVVVGDDSDGDALPDKTERNLVMVNRAEVVPPSLLVKPNGERSITIYNYDATLAERLFLRVLIGTGTASQDAGLEVGFGHGFNADDAVRQSLFQIGSLRTWSAGHLDFCGERAFTVGNPMPRPGQEMHNVRGPPFGTYNMDHDLQVATNDPWIFVGKSQSGFVVDVDVTHCRSAFKDQLGRGPVDFYAKVKNLHGSQDAVVQAFDVYGLYRPSVFSHSSGLSGRSDYEVMRGAFPGRPFTLDLSRDLVSRDWDPDDRIPTSFPHLSMKIVPGFSGPALVDPSIEFRLWDETPLVLTSFKNGNGQSIPVNGPTSVEQQPFPGLVFDAGLKWTLSIPAGATGGPSSAYNSMVAEFEFLHGAGDGFERKLVLDITGAWMERSGGMWVFHLVSVDLEYRAGHVSLVQPWSRGIQVNEDVDFLVLGVKSALAASDLMQMYRQGGKAVPAVVASNAALYLLELAAAVVTLDGNIVEWRPGGQSSLEIRREWVDHRGHRHDSMYLMNFPSNYHGLHPDNDVRAFLEDPQGVPAPVEGVAGRYRWFHEDGNGVMMLVSDHAGVFYGGARFQYRSLDQLMGAEFQRHDADFGLDMFSLERLVGDEWWGADGSFERLPCHVGCFQDTQPSTGSDTLVRSALGLYMDGSIRSSFELLDGNVGSLRLASGAMGDHREAVKGTVALSLGTMLYAYRMASQDVEAKRVDVAAYWGELGDDELCIERPWERRCLSLSKGSMHFGLPLQTFPHTAHPFTVVWGEGGAFEVEDVVSATAVYWLDPRLHAGGEASVARSVRHLAIDEAFDAESWWRSQGGVPAVDGTVRVAFDFSGPVVGEWSYEAGAPSPLALLVGEHWPSWFEHYYRVE